MAARIGNARRLGHRGQFVGLEIRQRPVRRQRSVAPGTAHEFVAIGCNAVRDAGIAHDDRPQEHEQVRLHAPAVVEAEQLPEHRHVAKARHLLLAPFDALLDQPAEHDDLAVVDEHVRFDRPAVRDDPGGQRRALHARDFLEDLHPDRARLGDRRLHVQRGAHVAPLDRLERVHGTGGRAGVRELAGDERHVLADDDPRFLVVEREQVGRGEDVRVGVGLERACQEAEVQDLADSRHRDGAAHDAQIQTLAHDAGIGGNVEDVRAGATRRQVGTADHARGTLWRLEELPLHAELGCPLGADLDDQRLDVDLRSTRIELVDDGAQIAIDRFGSGDDQRVRRRVGGDRRRTRLHGDRLQRSLLELHRADVAALRLHAGAGACARLHARLQPARRTGRAAQPSSRVHCAAGRDPLPVALPARAGAAGAGQHAAQRLGELDRLGVAQVDDVHVAGLAAGLVETGDQRSRQAHPGGAVRAHHDRVEPRVGHDQHALAGIDLGAGAGTGSIVEHPVHGQRDIGSDRMLDPDDLDAGGRRRVERCDDPRHSLQVGRVVGDDQRVVVRVRDDRIVRRDQRPQHRHQVRCRLVAKPEDLRDDLVAGSGRRASGHDGARLQLRIGLGHHLGQRAGIDDREALRAQGRLQQLVGAFTADRLRRLERHLAAHARIDDEAAAEQMAESADHRFDVGILEVQRDAVLRIALGAVGRRGTLARALAAHFALALGLCRSARQAHWHQEAQGGRDGNGSHRSEPAPARLVQDHAPILMMVRSPSRRPITPRKERRRSACSASACASAVKRNPERASQVPVPLRRSGPEIVSSPSRAVDPRPAMATR
ncbi:MAG TPA: hypothetical protein PK177_15535 [Burkholderiaceae bacterium]|nr:hypothetical protein [Burkholderiaceae bacterium]